MKRFSVHTRLKKGFSIVELLVVVSVIGILATVVFFSPLDARDAANTKAAQSDLEAIKFAIELYQREKGFHPPVADSSVGPTGKDYCTLCAYFDDSQERPWRWQEIADDLHANGYLNQLLYFDPWGNYYAYDNNFVYGCTNCSTAICSVGPDGVFTSPTSLGFPNMAAWFQSADEPPTGDDDICVFIPDDD